MVADIMCFQTYSSGWKFYFFLAIGVSALMLAFPIALTEDDEQDAYWGRCLSSSLTLVFTDVSFAILRGYVLFYEKQLQAGFTFFLKNIIVSIIRIILVCCGVKNTKRLIKSLRKTRDRYFWRTGANSWFRSKKHIFLFKWIFSPKFFRCQVVIRLIRRSISSYQERFLEKESY